MSDERAEVNDWAAGRPLRVLIAGGGTGGHLFPGLAVADALRRRVPGCEVRFAGSAYGLEQRVVPEAGYRLHLVPVRGLYQVSLRRKAWVLAMLPLAFLKSAALLLAFRPHLVLGVGGYASGPVLATALLLRFRCAIQEQNAYPGMTNRLLGRWVQRAFLPVADAHGFFPRAEVTGNPVREAIRALREQPDGAAAPRPEVRERAHLFVFGGSQGARAVNRAVVAALPRLREWGRSLQIVHQTGRADLEWVREAYAKAGVAAEVVPFIDDMAAAYRVCHLIVSRAGASAVDEIVTARRPSVLVPIPGTSGEHQARNAQRLADAGAAVVVPQSEAVEGRLGEAIVVLLDDPARLAAMEAATDALYPGDAAGRIAEGCLRLVR